VSQKNAALKEHALTEHRFHGLFLALHPRDKRAWLPISSPYNLEARN
ncbi:MAG: hypothetical protein ACI974_002031, partial [Paraglaciecola sp.]